MKRQGGVFTRLRGGLAPILGGLLLAVLVDSAPAEDAWRGGDRFEDRQRGDNRFDQRRDGERFDGRERYRGGERFGKRDRHRGRERFEPRRDGPARHAPRPEVGILLDGWQQGSSLRWFDDDDGGPDVCRRPDGTTTWSTRELECPETPPGE